MSVKLSLFQLWLSHNDKQSYGERENFSKCKSQNSLSLLEIVELFSKFLFLFSNLGKGISDFTVFSQNLKSLKKSLSPLKIWEKNIHFSFSSQNWRAVFQIYLSLFKTGKWNSYFTVFYQNLRFKKSLSPFKIWGKKIPFPFSSQKWRTFFQTSISLLKTGEKNFRFLFLFSKLEIC